MTPVILASRSAARGRLLAAAGISFSTVPADIDEEALVAAMSAQGIGPRSQALRLAEVKARKVATLHPGAIVIGGDQTLDLEGRTMTKPASIAEARAQLVTLRGRRHALHSAIVALSPGADPWTHVSSATLAVRDFSDAFLDDYIEKCGERTLESVGAYHVEGHGIQLFGDIEGDFFTILGLPLIPLLDYLRRREVLLR